MWLTLVQLRMIEADDAPELARQRAILEESADRLGGKPPFNRARRQRALDEVEGTLDDLDQRFYALNRKVDLAGLMTAYMREHPAAFCFDGLIERPDV